MARAGMPHEAMRCFGIAAYDCTMIGDSLTDLEAAKAADAARIPVRRGRAADFVPGTDGRGEGAG